MTEDKEFIRIPIGPIHPALEEPFKVTIVTDGEEIVDVDVRFGYNYRGLEWIAQRRNFINVMYMAERVCGICSFAHTYAYAITVENFIGQEIPERAKYIRAIVAELERIHSHLLITAVMAHNAGFDTWFMRLMQLREKTMDMLELITGNRVNYGIMTIGGVRRDIGDKEKRMLTEYVDYMQRKVLPEIIDLFMYNKTIENRFIGAGILSKEDARAYSVVGPVLRGSGIDHDIRRDFPYDAYGNLDFEVITPKKILGNVRGDSYDRTLVRIFEIVESLKIIEESLERLPSGPIHGKQMIPLPITLKRLSGRSIGRVEAPRGELLHYILAGNSEGPIRWKVRTPTEANAYALKVMLKGDQIADAPVTIASIDPCISCCDRITIIDTNTGEKYERTFDELLRLKSER